MASHQKLARLAGCLFIVAMMTSNEAYASKRQRWVELQRLKDESDIHRGYDSAARATPRDERHRRRNRSTGLSGRCYNEPAGGRRVESAHCIV